MFSWLKKETVSNEELEVALTQVVKFKSAFYEEYIRPIEKKELIRGTFTYWEKFSDDFLSTFSREQYIKLAKILKNRDYETFEVILDSCLVQFVCSESFDHPLKVAVRNNLSQHFSLVS